MNVLIVSQYFWPEEFRINDLALSLSRLGHNVTVLTGLTNYPGGKFFDGFGLRSCGTSHHDGIKILRVPLSPRGNGSGLRLLINSTLFTTVPAVPITLTLGQYCFSMFMKANRLFSSSSTIKALILSVIFNCFFHFKNKHFIYL